MGTPQTQIPPKPVVRGLAVITLLLGILAMVATLAYLPMVGWWWALLIGGAALATISAATVALITGDPDWLLLSLISPWH